MPALKYWVWLADAEVSAMSKAAILRMVPLPLAIWNSTSKSGSRMYFTA